MSNENEQQFHILPHPVKSNEPPQLGAGLNNKPEVEAMKGKGPHILSEDQIKSLDQPLSREELKKRSAELNK